MAPFLKESEGKKYPDLQENLMTSSGKIRIYELSKDLNLENKDVLDAAKHLSIAAKSHSSSITDQDATRIKDHLNGSKKKTPSQKNKPVVGKEILSLKKASTDKPKQNAPLSNQKQNKIVPNSPTSPQKPLQVTRSKNKTNLNIAASPTATKPLDKKHSNKPISPKPPSSPQRPAKETLTKNKPLNQQPQAGKPRVPVRPNIVGKPKSVNKSEPQELNKPNESKFIEPRSLSKPQTAIGSPRNNHINKNNNPNPLSPQGPKSRLVNRPQPQKPIAPPSRPNRQISPDKKRPPLNNKNNSGAPQNPNQSGRPGNRQRHNPGASRSPGQPRKINSLELVGKPIRRDKTGPASPPREGYRKPGSPSPNRPGMPSGMRKPVAPGELMQLQKPTGRPGSPTPRKDGNNQNAKKSADGTKTPNRPTPAPAPKRPTHKPGSPSGAGAPRRRPDWDDSAKLEALRNKSPQKQRQKVHIIGENDDALTTETSGFAGEQQAVVLSASLARPAKPKGTKKTSSKPMGAMRKRKKETTRQRQRRRAMELRAAREAKQVRPEMIVVPEDNLTVQELADKLSVESSEIIKSLFFKGITATVTQSLDLSTIEAVAEEFGVPVLQDDIEEAAKKTAEMIDEEDLKHLIRRPPVVTVMGHVDHGKTSLLDAIRKARVAAGEAGGITQHIGAYQVEIDHAEEKRKLTFLDTPGHEAFTAMRARGTKVTDVAVLVVAADDGVRPQTLEAISHARAAEVPIVVAINKIDKEGASPDRVKQELSDQNLVAEEWGGDVVMVPVSAIKGENIEKLLEMVLLVTEVEDLQANPNRLAKGTVIEAHLDKAKGPVATLLIQNGTLRTGDVLAAGPVLGKVRAMVDENGKRLKESGPSSAVEALGFSEVPTAGDEFEAYPDEKTARGIVGERATDARATRLAQQMASRRVSLSAISGQASEGELKELNLILKADVQGSVEAILGSLEQLPKDEVQVRVLLSAPGEISETDIDLAAASGAVIVGFNTSMASGAKRAADANSVDIREYEVIYKLLEDIQLAMEGLLEPEMVEEALGTAEVRAIFTIGKSAVAGCYLTNGKLQRNCKVRVKRKDQIVFEGDLDSLRRNKDDVKEVGTGFECGIGCDRFANWEEGDIVEGFKLVTQRRKLNT